MKQGDQFRTSFYLKKKRFEEVKASGLQPSFNIFRATLNLASIKPNCIKLQTIDPEICPILIFQKRVSEYVLRHILCMIFLEKCFLCYILLTDQISFSNCLYFLRNIFGNICIAIVCFPGCDVINFLMKTFFYMVKKTRENSNIFRTKRAFKRHFYYF